LQALALKLGFTPTGAPISATVEKTRKTRYVSPELFVTHAIQVGTHVKTHSFRSEENETLPVYLGFITLPRDSGYLPLVETVGNPVTLKQASEVCNYQAYGVSAVGEMVDGPITVVKSGWNYFHAMPMLGYSLESFQEVLNITEQGFEDDTTSCDGCNKFDSRDNGYQNNFREHDGEWLGINCGCFDEACAGNIEPFIDDPDTAIELKTAEKLAADGALEHVERFIGGMVDGRGGFYAGAACREGTPTKVLKTLKAENPDARYLFTIDETGQFQTYFSVWLVI